VLDKCPYARFDLNDYSVPPQYVRKTLVVIATLETVRILDGTLVVATHQRCYDRHRQIEDREHREQLIASKGATGEHRSTNLLKAAAPSAAEFLSLIAAEGLSLRRLTKDLLLLLHTYGAESLEAALSEALKSTPHLSAVRQILERERSEAAKPIPLPLTLPDDPRVQNMVLSPRPLSAYDQLQKRKL
jgi:hypothetical protein